MKHDVVRPVALMLAAIPLLALLQSTAANAEKADRKEKIKINAVDGDADHAKGFYKLEKSVVITQGTLKLTADRGTAQTTPDDNYNAVLNGKPVCFRQRTDNGDWAQGVSDRVDYDSGKGIVELFGNAVLFIGEDETTANYIIYNTQTSKYEARESKERKSEGKGVSFVLQPREKDESSGDGATKPAAKPVAKAPAVKQANPPKRNEPAFSRCA
jgi:lipopolysaccharide export system protein LptA